MKRSRGRGRRQQNPVNRSYDSNGPDVRVRGTASQVFEKYQALARDAMSSGDRVMAENYSQHAEHYFRILQSFQPTPSEADKDNAEAASDEAAAPGNGQDGDSEPLVLVRDSSEGDDKPAKPSRRRGPLRNKKKADSGGDENGAALANADGEAAADVTPVEETAVEAALEVPPAD